jgi:hypothetical protein
MLRSSGRTLGAVVVEGGAEKVREPRLPKLPPIRASASDAASASAATMAQSASSGRKRWRIIRFLPEAENDTAKDIGIVAWL